MAKLKLREITYLAYDQSAYLVAELGLKLQPKVKAFILNYSEILSAWGNVFKFFYLNNNSYDFLFCWIMITY